MDIQDSINNITKDTTDKMDKSVQNLQRALQQIRSGRVSASLIEGVQVEVYGQYMSITQLGTINVPEARQLTVEVWDHNNTSVVYQALQNAKMNINPKIEGNLIRIVMPDLTEENRKAYVKLASQQLEEHKIALRSIRRDGNEMLKKIKKDGLSEDAFFSQQEKIQGITNDYSAKMDAMFASKETDIMRI